MREPTWIKQLGGLPKIAPPVSLADAALAEAEDNQHEAENGICAEGDCSNDQ